MKSKTKASPLKTRRMVTLWVPEHLHEKIEHAVAGRETDKSKWIREAMKEKAARDTCNSGTSGASGSCSSQMSLAAAVPPDR